MKAAKAVDVNWLSYAPIKIFTEPLGQRFSGNSLFYKENGKTKKYSLPGLRGLGTCNLSLESTSCRGFKVTQVDENRQISRCELAVVCP
ncbi:MAG: hypothetical protein CRN43_11585 [Candidatus Nephrothrix sp. EaCA]|nr:MAG: hypothetical protein CRN43_11585 [Candidatus Nephrothrix sp. EaCA]